jgi:hypothetical protein
MHILRLSQRYQAEQNPATMKKITTLKSQVFAASSVFSQHTLFSPADTTISVSMESAANRRSRWPQLRAGSLLIAMLSKLLQIVAHGIHRLLESRKPSRDLSPSHALSRGRIPYRHAVPTTTRAISP